MKLKCPNCGHECDYREAARDSALVEIIKMQADFAPHSKLVFEYAELFNTTRPIKAAKLLRILAELRELWTAGRFTLNKRSYAISREGMARALKTVCNKNLTGLDSHNYLKKVMVSVAEEEAQKRSAEAEKELMKRETGLRAGTRKAEAPASIGEVVKNLPWKRED